MQPNSKDRVGLLALVLFPLRFVLLFAAVGALVAYWEHLLNALDRRLHPVRAKTGAEVLFEYFCPMHPAVVRDEPGKCPICGMGLVKRKAGARLVLPEGVLARVSLSPSRVALAGFATEEVAPRLLVREIRTVGAVAFDERRIARLVARVAGRADELFVDFTGVRVKEGDPVYKIYSPDLVTTQEEYLVALRNLEEAERRRPRDEAALKRSREMVAAARERLRLWGIREEQIETLRDTRKAETHLVIHSPISGVVVEKSIQAGRDVPAGADLYVVADDSVVWVVAEVFERDIAFVQEGRLVEIATEAHPGESFEGRVAFIHPTVEEATRTVKVRLDVPNPDRKLKPGMYVTAVLRVPLSPAGKGFYCCVDHPDVRAGAPGKCPACERELLRQGPPEGAPAPAGKEEWTCSMHPEVVRSAPGACPKCGMNLVRRAPPAPAPAPAAVPGFRCPVHPVQSAEGRLRCPECNREMAPIPVEPVLAVPAAAVIDTGTRKVVFLDRGEGTYEAVEAILGHRSGDYHAVLSGLKKGDRVVTAGAFLLDAETRINTKAGAAYFGAEKPGHRH